MDAILISGKEVHADSAVRAGAVNKTVPPRLHVMVMCSLVLHAWIMSGHQPQSTGEAVLPRFINVEIGMESVPAKKTSVPQPVNTVQEKPESIEESTSGMPLVEARHDLSELDNPRPRYPLAARRRGNEGRVLLRAHVTRNGICDRVQLIKSSGHRLLDKSAIRAVQQWRFMPAQQDGMAQDSWLEIPINFRLKN